MVRLIPLTPPLLCHFTIPLNQGTEIHVEGTAVWYHGMFYLG